MEVSRINLINRNGLSFNNPNFKTLNSLRSYNAEKPQSTNLSNVYPKNYFISFGARGMSLERFYNVNKDRMPKTVKDHIENLPDINAQTPLEAHIEAFSLLADPEIQTADDVKFLFDEEPLFANLKSVNETKAKRGFLYEARIMEETLKEAGESILNSGEDLTLYLLKKIFLEAKSLTDINKDLDKDLNPVFKREEKNYMTYSAFESLGIELPANEYLTSLRTTDTDYSKKIGGLISEALKKSASKKSKEASGQNLPKREVSDETREKMSKAQAARWEKLSDSERVDLIDKMQTGNEFQRTVMTDAWNQCPDIRKDLSQYLIRHNINRPENIIYGTEGYTEYQSEIMTEFWKMHHNEDESKDYSKILGKEIKKARKRAELANENNNFDEYKKSVYEKTAKIKEEIKELRKTVISKEQRYKEAREELFGAYKKAYSFLPESFVKFYLSDLQALDTDSVETWAKVLKGEKADELSNKHLLEQMKAGKTDTVSREKNAAEIAMKTVLYSASKTGIRNSVSGTREKDARVYNLSYKDLISCLSFAKQIKNYPTTITLRRGEGSSQDIQLAARPDFSAVKTIYEHCMKDIDDTKAENLASHLIGVLGADVCGNAKIDDNGVSALTSALYITYKDSFSEEIKRMGNIIPFAAKKGIPAERFYARRVAENLGLMETIEKIKADLAES